MTSAGGLAYHRLGGSRRALLPTEQCDEWSNIQKVHKTVSIDIRRISREIPVSRKKSPIAIAGQNRFNSAVSTAFGRKG